MDERFRQIAARLTLHEFVLEVIYAQLLANVPAEEAAAARARLLQLMRSAYAAPDADPSAISDDDLLMLQDAQELARRFLDKVLHRSEQIREQSARAGSRP